MSRDLMMNFYKTLQIWSLLWTLVLNELDRYVPLLIWTFHSMNRTYKEDFYRGASLYFGLIKPSATIKILLVFDRYTWNSTFLSYTLVCQFQMQFLGWAQGFHIWLNKPPTHALRPVIPLLFFFLFFFFFFRSHIFISLLVDVSLWMK